MSERVARVAVVGGGVAGAAAAAALAGSDGAPPLAVTVFDYGRGPGGRAGFRCEPFVEAGAAARLRFDHGAQFLRVAGGAPTAWREAVGGWEAAGLVERWRPRLEVLRGDGGGRGGGDGGASRGCPPATFFGLGAGDDESAALYVSPDGQGRLVSALLSGSAPNGVVLRTGTRVRSIERRDVAPSGGVAGAPRPCWRLRGNGANTAHHMANEASVSALLDAELGEFDGVVLTDVMASYPKWHRAAVLGLADASPELSEAMRGRRMSPLFAWYDDA